MQSFFRVVRVFRGLFHAGSPFRSPSFSVFCVFRGFSSHAVLFLCVLCVLWFPSTLAVLFAVLLLVYFVYFVVSSPHAVFFGVFCGFSPHAVFLWFFVLFSWFSSHLRRFSQKNSLFQNGKG